MRNRAVEVGGKASKEWFARADELEKALLYTDISDMVVQVIEHELQGKFVGDGWREWKEGV